MSGNDKTKEKFKAVGCGFAGLDIVKYGASETLLPGGTCANVMSVLASLNWQTTIIKPEYSDVWNSYIDSTWEGLGISVCNCLRSKLPTPRVIQEFIGHEHYFYTRCPKCETPLLNIVLPTRESIKKGFVDFDCDILYYDRVSAGIRYLIELCNLSNKWTFYEPNNARSYKTFVNNISECGIVKFSDKRIPSSASRKLLTDLKTTQAKTKIVIITHESLGVSYSIFRNGEYSKYETIYVKPLADVVDSSGAGDWLAAGFIDDFVSKCPEVPEEVNEETVVSALSWGQKQVEKCCSSVGAIGGLIGSKIQQTPPSDSKCQYCRI